MHPSRPRRLLAAAGALATLAALTACQAGASPPDPGAPAAPGTPPAPGAPAAAGGSATAGAGDGAAAGHATSWAPPRSWAPAPRTSAGLTSVATTSGRRMLVHTAGGDRDFLPGVNLGATTPGHGPGELAVTAGDYRRWFAQMGELGFRAVRIYTVHPPAFYTELAAYNRAHPGAPLYLVAGVYLPDESYVTGGDLYAPAVTDAFAAELTDAVAAVHGDLNRPARRGHAAGTWLTDVSAWVAGYIVGVEWDPAATRSTNARRAGTPAHRGRYFSSGPRATPVETWLARMLDRTAAAEAARGRSMPLAFANWPTTDPLRHPTEPEPHEDLVGVDAEHITVHRDAWPGGFFAEYHAYPYYPDFQRSERGLRGTRWRGRPDPYAGYLARLRDHHSMPVVLGEFGVPSSAGSAHAGPLGRGQGDHSEAEAMAIDADLFRLAAHTRLSGAFLFSWTDEWFKRTWNTADRHLPAERRQLWTDAYTNEQHFGVLATDPGDGTGPALGGDPARWNRLAPVALPDPEGPGGADGAGPEVREVRAGSDEGYLYLRIRLRTPVRDTPAVGVAVDVLPGGGTGPPGAPGAAGAEYAVRLPAGPRAERPGARAQVWVRADEDPFAATYGRALRAFPVGPDVAGPGRTTGGWLPQRLVTNLPQTEPGTGRRLPVEYQDVGLLRAGPSDPAAAGYDNRNAWAVDGDTVQLRLPWAAVGVADPSSRQALDLGPDGEPAATAFDRLGLTVLVGDSAVPTAGYTWEPWNRPRYRERLKQGSGVLATAVRALN